MRKTVQVANVLLDQSVFAGMGNIIKDEVLSLERIDPKTPMARPSPAKRKALIARTRKFSLQFLRWRKVNVLRKDLRIYRRYQCRDRGGPVLRGKTGMLQRGSYDCMKCQLPNASKPGGDDSGYSATHRYGRVASCPRTFPRAMKDRH